MVIVQPHGACKHSSSIIPTATFLTPQKFMQWLPPVRSVRLSAKKDGVVLDSRDFTCDREGN